MPDKETPVLNELLQEFGKVVELNNNMFNGNGPRAQYIIASSTSKQAGGYAILTMGDVYKIVHDRLEYARYSPMPNHAPKPISDLLDIDALCQNVCCEIEKKLGIYPNVPPAEEREYEA